MKRPGAAVPLIDPPADVDLDLGHTAVRRPAQLAGGQLGEPPLEKVQPA